MIRSKKLSKFKGIKHAFFNKIDSKSNDIYKRIILPKQTHSNKFYYIDKKVKFIDKKLEVDALITSKKKTPIGVLTADCAPVLIFDKENYMIAAIHAGWKGAYKDIIKKVIKFMIKKGCIPKNLMAVVGPCISIKNYEIKQDFKKKFIKKDVNNRVFFRKIGNRNFFNLNKYIHFQLKCLDIKEIEIINKDTFNIKNNFFSARRSISLNETDYGRNISIIMIN